MSMETVQLKLHSLELQGPTLRQTKTQAVYYQSHRLLLPAVVVNDTLRRACHNSNLIPQSDWCNWHLLRGQYLVAASDYGDPRHVLLHLGLQAVWQVLSVPQNASSPKRECFAGERPGHTE
mmetsp:Transcript_110856/g.220489  ORF Transcript_110856/g.220489 Transcript_110856/m.220489 type:complete len:121 (-) Transcript_110856:584-946(-)